MFSRQLPECSRYRHDAGTGTLCTGFDLVSETVANAGDGEDETWPLEERFDFLAQLSHIDVEAVRPGMRLVSPDLFQQHLPRENLAAVCNEDLEQVVLGGRQGDIPSLDPHTPLGEINGERPGLKARLGTARWLD